MSEPLEIGVICAIPEERQALARVFSLSGSAGEGPFGVLSGRAGTFGLRLAQAGIGKGNVAALTAHMLTRYPDLGLMVFCGIAGGLHPGLDPGDLVIGAETATHDYGALRNGRLDWFRAGDIPLGPAPPPGYDVALSRTPALDRAIADFRARRPDRRTVEGRIISGDLFLNCRDTRDRLHGQWAADAIDMESAAFADAARRFGAPTLILRTISDRACEDSHVTYAEMADAAAGNSADFLAAYVARLAEDPDSVARLRR